MDSSPNWRCNTIFNKHFRFQAKSFLLGCARMSFWVDPREKSRTCPSLKRLGLFTKACARLGNRLILSWARELHRSIRLSRTWPLNSYLQEKSSRVALLIKRWLLMSTWLSYQSHQTFFLKENFAGPLNLILFTDEILSLN